MNQNHEIMKKLGLTVSSMLAGVTLLFAQEVPDTVRSAFTHKYPDAGNVQWRMENDNYYATYEDTGKMGHTIIYDRNGQVSGQQSQVGNKDIPGGISDYYRTHYPNEKNYKVWLEQDQNGQKKYYVPGKSETVYFDQDGNFTNKEANKNNNLNGTGNQGGNMNKNGTGNQGGNMKQNNTGTGNNSNTNKNGSGNQGGNMNQNNTGTGNNSNTNKNNTGNQGDNMNKNNTGTGNNNGSMNKNGTGTNKTGTSKNNTGKNNTGTSKSNGNGTGGTMKNSSGNHSGNPQDTVKKQ
jgi:hypothetical protein